jgi:glycosyltransferase involved in cell wall biosynthesis
LISKKEFNNLKNEVSILCYSYNFKKSVEKCLDSILSQIISIPITIYCIDDCSSDGTQEILKKYADKNKKKIRLILSNVNMKSPSKLLLSGKYNIDFNSKYFCQIDGDDYWTDVYNLQKKVEVLKNNKKIIGCSSITKMINKDKITLIKPTRELFTKSDMIIRSEPFYCHSSSLLWKNFYYNKKTKLPFPRHFGYGADGDYFFFNQMLDSGHQIYVINQVMSVYNYTGKGVWSSLKGEEQEKLNKILSIKVFYYSSFKYKVLILIFSLNKYLIKELRYIKNFLKF